MNKLQSVSSKPKMLTGAFGSGTLVYLGKRKLRTSDEATFASDNKLDAADLMRDHSETYPDTWADVSYVKVLDVMQHGGTGIVVDQQKFIRHKLELSQVTTLRNSMRSKYPELSEANPDYPIFVIDWKTVGSAIELEPVDKLERIKVGMPQFFQDRFAGLSEEEQLEQVAEVYAAIQAIGSTK
ncbi:MAG TPA: hypothetical protein ENI23_06035 [bacterium]|nr:hypothetical protein [bacterium]